MLLDRARDTRANFPCETARIRFPGEVDPNASLATIFEELEELVSSQIGHRLSAAPNLLYVAGHARNLRDPAAAQLVRSRDFRNDGDFCDPTRARRLEL